MRKVTVNGLGMRYEIHGRGEPLLLIHGTESNISKAWNAQLPVFGKEYRCIVYNLRGVGDSEAGEVRPFTTRLLAEDAVGLLRALGVPRAHIAGLSLGSCIGQEMAINYPELVHTLSLYSTWDRPHPYLRRALEIRQRLRGMVERRVSLAYGVLSLFPADFIDEHEDEVIRFETGFVKDPVPLDIVTEQYNANLTHDAADRLHLIRCPTLIIQGAGDLITLPKYAKAVHEAILGSKLVMLEGAGHLLQSQMPEEFNRVSLEFLRRHPMSRQSGMKLSPETCDPRRRRRAPGRRASFMPPQRGLSR